MWWHGWPALSAIALGLAAAPAQAVDLERVTTGPSGGNAPRYTELLLSSRDGTRAVFASDEDLTPDDRRPYFDFYERVGDVTRLLGQDAGLDDPKHTMPVFGASTDARTLVFSGGGRWTADDRDDQFTADTYRLRDGVAVRVSQGPLGGDADSFDAVPTGMSADGERILFETAEQLAVGDTDYKTRDVYRWEGGAVTWISGGAAGAGNADGRPAEVAGHSADARVVILRSLERLTADDRDDQWDLFARSGSSLVKVSPGDGPHPAEFDAVSADGSVVVLHTLERLTGDDEDDRSDAYRVAGGQVTRVSTGPSGGNGDHGVGFESNRIGGDVLHLTPDGARVVFSTYEPLTPDDTDHQLDSYRWGPEGTIRVSTGPTGGNGEYDVNGWNLSGLVQGGADDASSLVFLSREQLTPDDTDLRTDFFEWTPQGVRRVTTGPTGGNAPVDVVCVFRDPCGRLAFVSSDGARIVFETEEALVPEDADDLRDVYLRAGGATTLLTPARADHPPGHDAVFVDGADDGSILYVESEEQLTPDDQNTRADGYRARAPAPGAAGPSQEGTTSEGATASVGDAAGAPSGASSGAPPTRPTDTGTPPPRVRPVSPPSSVRLLAGRTRVSATGSGVKLSASAATPVFLVAERLRPGRRVGASCRAPSPRLRARPPCTRALEVARPLRLRVPQGRSVLRLGAPLRTGRHRLTLTPVAPGAEPARLTLRLRR